MDILYLSSLIIKYRYFVLIPLSTLEGPIVALSAGTLASLGYFNVYVLLLFFIVLDLGKDVVYYMLGHWGRKTTFVQKILKKIDANATYLEQSQTLWERHPGKTMFLGKLSYGVSVGFVIFAGVVGIPFRRFIAWGFVVAVLQYGGLLAVGYFFGKTLSTNTTLFISDTLLAIGGVTLIGSLYYIATDFLSKKYNTKNPD